MRKVIQQSLQVLTAISLLVLVSLCSVCIYECVCARRAERRAREAVAGRTVPSVVCTPVKYGPEPWQFADIVARQPCQHVNARSPVVIWIHGGGWNSGTRRGTEAKCREFVRRTGIVGLNIDYRLGNAEAPCWPQANEDIAQAIAFARGDQMPCAGEARRVFLYGYSAGGTLAVLHALENPSVEAVVAVGAPLDFNQWRLDKYLTDGFGADWQSWNPAALTDGEWPALLMLHGSADSLVPLRVNTAIVEALPSVRWVEIDGGDHTLRGKEDVEFAEALRMMVGRGDGQPAPASRASRAR